MSEGHAICKHVGPDLPGFQELASPWLARNTSGSRYTSFSQDVAEEGVTVAGLVCYSLPHLLPRLLRALGQGGEYSGSGRRDPNQPWSCLLPRSRSGHLDPQEFGQEEEACPIRLHRGLTSVSFLWSSLPPPPAFVISLWQVQRPTAVISLECRWDLRRYEPR